MSVDWRELERERISRAELGMGPPIFYPAWVCGHGAHDPTDTRYVRRLAPPSHNVVLPFSLRGSKGRA